MTKFYVNQRVIDEDGDTATVLEVIDDRGLRVKYDCSDFGWNGLSYEATGFFKPLYPIGQRVKNPINKATGVIEGDSGTGRLDILYDDGHRNSWYLSGCYTLELLKPVAKQPSDLLTELRELIDRYT